MYYNYEEDIEKINSDLKYHLYVYLFLFLIAVLSLALGYLIGEDQKQIIHEAISNCQWTYSKNIENI